VAHPRPLWNHRRPVLVLRFIDGFVPPCSFRDRRRLSSYHVYRKSTPNTLGCAMIDAGFYSFIFQDISSRLHIAKRPMHLGLLPSSTLLYP
jgi:hypothetical protein